MSRTNEQWVWDHSPYGGGMLLLHLAMGDLANEENADELWAGDGYLAEKARISVGSVRRYRGQMVIDGFLQVIEAGGGRGKRHRVRLLKPDRKPAQIEQVSDPAKPAQMGPETRANEAVNARNDDIALLVNPNKPKDPTQGGASTAVLTLVEPSDVHRLCDLLADRVETHRGARPKMTDSWAKDMDLLVRRGPTDWAEPTEIKPGAVAKVIRGVFDLLATASPSGFCWADQIRSPGALRSKWETLVLALRRAENPTAGADPAKRKPKPTLGDRVAREQLREQRQRERALPK